MQQVNFYCRSYCLLNMFQGTIMPIIRNSRVLYKWLLPVVFDFGHHFAHRQELESIIQVVAACGIWCFGFQIVGMVWS